MKNKEKTKDEVISEKQWERAFADSEDVLDKLADKAIAEHAQGRTKPLNANHSCIEYNKGFSKFIGRFA